MTTPRERYECIYSLVRELRGLEIDLSDMRDDGYDEHRPAYRAAAARRAIVKGRLEDLYSDLLGYGHVVDAAQCSRDAYENWHSPFAFMLPTNKIGAPQLHSDNPPTGDRYYSGINAKFNFDGKRYTRSKFQPWQLRTVRS